MKILHIGNLKSGIDTYVRNTVAMADERFEFVIVNGADDNNKPYIRKGREVCNYKISMYRALNPIMDFKAVIQTIKIIRKEKPDIVHCHSAKGGIIGRMAAFLANKPSFYTPHAFSFLSAESDKKRMLYLLFEKMAKLNSRMLACSQSEKQLGVRMVKFREDRAFVWNNAIQDIDDGDIITPKGIDLNEKFIISVGRPSYQKNPLLMVDIMRIVHQKHPELKLYLVGVGFYSPLLDELKQMIHDYELDNTIRLVPWLSREETLGYLKQAQLYLTTSYYEGLPIAVLEALALKKVIVSSDVIGNKDCVRNEYNGYLLPMDANQFAKKINYLLNNTSDLKRMELNSRQYFESDFLIDKRIKSLENIYLNL